MKKTLIHTLLGLSGLGLVALLLLLGPGPVAVRAAQPPLALTIVAAPTSVQAGEQVQFKATLQNTGAANLQNVLLTLTLTGPADRMQPAILPAESSDMRTDKVRRQGQVVQWKGDLQAGGQVTLGLRVRSAAIPANDQAAALQLDGEAGPVGAEAVISASKAVTVSFPAPVDASQIDLEKRILDENGQALTGMLEGGKIMVMPRQKVIVELRLTNNSDQTLYSLLVDEMSSAPGAAAGQQETASCRLQVVSSKVTEGQGFNVPASALGDPLPGGLTPATLSGAFVVKTEPGQTSVARLRGRVLGAPDCQLQGQMRVYPAAVAPGGQNDIEPGRLAFIQSLLENPPSLGELIVLIILLNDYGDAPDSSNHFGVNMTAYPPYFMAYFPTVFDPATGAPPGPKHKNGLPLHLGALSSGEWAADNYLNRNLNPSADLANLDIRDDGVNVSALNFQPCLPTTIPVQVTLRQSAVNYFASTGATAYLNIWLDGNHDGDWNDALDCDGIRVTEHIVVDQPITSATAGLFSLMAPTSNIPIPLGGENETMWLRVTLSDAPSEKPFSIISKGQVVFYGDGRGPASAFRWGETEDYLYVPSAAAASEGGAGPRLALDGEAVVQSAREDNSLQTTSANASLGDEVALKIRFRNRGDRTAQNARLIIAMAPYGGLPTLRQGQGPVAEVCQDGDCHLEVMLGDMAPGAGEELLMVWKASSDRQYDFDLKIESDNVVDTLFQTAARRQLRPLVILSPRPGILGSSGCLTCTTTFKGLAEPGSSLVLSYSGLETGEAQLTADANGFWQMEAPLPEGGQDISLRYAEDVLFSAGVEQFMDKYSADVRIDVDPTLAWNPNSFGMRVRGKKALFATGLLVADASGPLGFGDDAGRADLEGWKIPVWSGGDYELGVDLICDGVAGASLSWKGLATPKPFADTDGDGRFTLELTAAEVEASPYWEDGVAAVMAVSCDENEALYGGKIVGVAPARVSDAATGQPLAGALVRLWERNPNSAGTRFISWQAPAFGQSNPQMSDENGYFSFITPSGSYGLTAQLDGYQPFRVGPLHLQQGPFPPTIIPLTSRQNGATAAQVMATADGFDPPVVTVRVGEIVAWLNTDLEASAAASADSLAANAVNPSWESGQLAAGESHRRTFGEAGDYAYSDPNNPANQGIIRVLPPEAGSLHLFLPIMAR